MRDFNLVLEAGKKPNYQKVADSVRNAIIAGHLKVGEKLPATRALARHLKLHRHTIMTAFNELIAEGWIASNERKAYCVSEIASNLNPRSPIAERSDHASKHRWRLARSVEMAWNPIPNVPHVFTNGAIDFRLFPRKEFRSVLMDSIRFIKPDHLNYGDPAGFPPLIEALRTYLRRARAVSDREIIVVNGAQEGIFLAGQMLLKPGDRVAVEQLGWSCAWEALRAAGAVLVPIEVDREGINPEALARRLKRDRIRLLYMTPLHQFPTTVTLPMARRLQIYDLARKHSVPILEDDYDHEFHYTTQPLAPMASSDPAELVIYVSTFSKMLFPSCRIGFMAVPKVLAQPILNYRRIITRQNEVLFQSALARWIQEGGFERHVRRIRRAYDERRRAMCRSLQVAKDAGLDISWINTEGGIAIWADFKTDAAQLARRALHRGVFVRPESHFQLKPSHGTHLNLPFTNQTPDEIDAGMNILFNLRKGGRDVVS
jgi:GntR family transcriptional regulator/MocR family aminotransferase